jgi:hypothetical protein
LGSAIMGLLLGGFYLAQRRGFFGFIAKASRRILGAWDLRSVTSGAVAIDSAVVTLYRDRRAIVSSTLWHLLSWIFGIGEVWIALRLLGRPVDIWTALLIESLGQAIRTGSFAVPGSLGVQESGYVLLGNALGIEPQVSLALSLARRVREVLLGLPGLVAAQVEGLSRGRRRSRAAARPHLARTINAGGRVLGRLGAFRGKLAERELLEEARRKTGLADFGDQTFREPLRRLLESMEAEARLNPLGRVAARQDLIRLLVNRLRMEADRKAHPQIAAEEVRRPLIITGLPRTGTTLLHNLLALDPAHRVPLTWETMHPSPPPETATYLTDWRIRVAERQVRWFHRLVKDFNRIHPVEVRLPEECLVIFSHSFLSYQFETTHRLPSYLGWLEAQDLRPAYQVHRRFLQYLQWRCPGERWVLKAPAHLFDLEAMFSVYPDAAVIVTHRDPLQVAASNASLTAVLRSAFSDEVDPLEVGEECSRRWAEGIGRSLRSRDRGCAPPEQFLDLYYRDLTRDPLATVRRVYDHFQLRFSEGLEESIRRYLAKNPKDKYGTHRYTLEEFGLDPEREKERYRPYRERFGL